jgi:hypothetical protein
MGMGISCMLVAEGWGEVQGSRVMVIVRRGSFGFGNW